MKCCFSEIRFSLYEWGHLWGLPSRLGDPIICYSTQIEKLKWQLGISENTNNLTTILEIYYFIKTTIFKNRQKFTRTVPAISHPCETKQLPRSNENTMGVPAELNNISVISFVGQYLRLS